MAIFNDIATINLPKIRRGDTLEGAFNVKSNGVAIDFTTATVLIQFKVNKQAPAAFTLTLGNGLTGNSTGDITYNKVFDVLQLKDTTYLFDVQITFPNGKIKTYIEGTMLVIQDVSRIAV